MGSRVARRSMALASAGSPGPRPQRSCECGEGARARACGAGTGPATTRARDRTRDRNCARRLGRDQVDWVAADVHFPGRDVLAGAERAVLDLPPTATRARRIAR